MAECFPNPRQEQVDGLFAAPTVGPMATPDAASRRMRSSHRGQSTPAPEHRDTAETRTADRWAWRRRIRADPRKVRIYRVLIAVLGLLLILFGALTGPLPGPGGIPLVLLGLAVWASEFAWAHRVMQWLKLQLHKLRGWSRPRQALAWLIFFSCLGALGYADLLVFGVPTWVPPTIAAALHRLPGVA